MSQANIDKFNAEIMTIEEKIKSLEAEYAGKKNQAEQEANAKLDTLKSTKGKEIENLENDLNHKQKTFDETSAALTKAKEELKLAKQTHKAENSIYLKDIKLHDKEAATKLKGINSELKKLIKENNSDIKNLDKQIKQETKAIEKAMAI